VGAGGSRRTQADGELRYAEEVRHRLHEGEFLAFGRGDSRCLWPHADSGGGRSASGSTASGRALKTGRATGGACAFWQVPQAFDWANYRKGEDPAKYRAPTYDEVRTMTYLALINGAKGLIYYSFFDLRRDHLGFDARWRDVSRIGQEVRDLTPAILSVDPPPAGVMVSGPRWAAMRNGKRLWVLVTNPEPQTVPMRLALPAGAGAIRTLGGREIAARDGVVAEDFKPLACETFVVDLN
jgi:hypothetical protein